MSSHTVDILSLSSYFVGIQTTCIPPVSPTVDIPLSKLLWCPYGKRTTNNNQTRQVDIAEGGLWVSTERTSFCDGRLHCEAQKTRQKTLENKSFEGCRPQKVSWSCNWWQMKWISQVKVDVWWTEWTRNRFFSFVVTVSAPLQWQDHLHNYRQGSQLRPKVGLRHKSRVLVLIEFVPSQRETERERELDQWAIMCNTQSLHFHFASYVFRCNIFNGSVVNTLLSFLCHWNNVRVCNCVSHTLHSNVKNISLGNLLEEKKSPFSIPIYHLQVFAKPSVNCCILCVGLQIIMQTLHKPITEVNNALYNCNGPYETNIFQAS